MNSVISNYSTSIDVSKIVSDATKYVWDIKSSDACAGLYVRPINATTLSVKVLDNSSSSVVLVQSGTLNNIYLEAKPIDVFTS